MILADSEIRKLCVDRDGAVANPLIEPFSEPVSGNGIISYGLTSAGYDVRLCSKEILVFKNPGEAINPKKFSDPDYRRRMFESHKGLDPHAEFVIPPNGYVLAQTHEYIRMPRHLIARCVGKSTLARSAVVVNTTPMEPEWEGHLTLEIFNPTLCPMTIFVMEGIAQFQFEMVHGKVDVSYKDKGGKYDRQKGVTPAIVR